VFLEKGLFGGRIWQQGRFDLEKSAADKGKGII
jgi:hypothetical protein